VTESEFVARLRTRATELGLSISGSQARELEKFYSLLAKWNPRINLTALELGSSPQKETLDRLFLEPLIAAELIPNIPLTVIDLGSGAGSPALPIKVLRPTVRLTMVETKGRKAAFLREAVRTLGLREVDVEQTRFQALPASLSSEFDLALVRALKVDEDLLATVLDLLKPEGRFITFGVNQVLPGFVVEDSLRLPDGSQVVSWLPSEDAFLE
jgi:16S rRNA (guanine527-N7)-methyltransferase